jgi:hypothetical protein
MAELVTDLKDDDIRTVWTTDAPRAAVDDDDDATDPGGDADGTDGGDADGTDTDDDATDPS